MPHNAEMSKKVSYVLLCATAWMSAAVAAGCKEDPPPPPIAAAPSDAVTGEAAPGSAAVTRPQGRGAIPRVDAATTKRSRVEACYWGALGIEKTRDAYLASTKDAAPSAEKIPAFGEFPEHAKRAEAMKKAGREPAQQAINLPYLRHLRACKHAKSATGVKMDGVDEALAAWEPYVSKLHETLVKATRYYAREAYKKDDFKEGLAHHKTLTELLPQYDEKLAEFTKAVDAWNEANAKWQPKDELDEAGKVAHEAIEKSRGVAKLLMADKRDKAAIDKLLGEVKGLFGELETIREEQRRPPHPKVVGPKIKEFMDAAAAASALEGDGKLTADQLYPVTSSLALIHELNQRSLEQLLRQRAATHRKPLKTMDPSQPQAEGADPHQGDPTRRIRGGLRQQ